jgi:integrase
MQIGWHTYSSLLAATGDDVKVVQELMRHAKISTTMEVYAQAGLVPMPSPKVQNGERRH